jgi:hypothetical protein
VPPSAPGALVLSNNDASGDMQFVLTRGRGHRWFWRRSGLSVEPSRLFVDDGHGAFTVSIGQAAILREFVPNAARVCEFIGILRPNDEYETAAREGTDAYGTRIDDNCILDSQGSVHLCVASMVNSIEGALNTDTDLPAVPNVEIVVDVFNRRVYYYAIRDLHGEVGDGLELTVANYGPTYVLNPPPVLDMVSDLDFFADSSDDESESWTGSGSDSV